MVKHCIKCGEKIQEDAAFCGGCGAKVEKEAPVKSTSIKKTIHAPKAPSAPVAPRFDDSTFTGVIKNGIFEIVSEHRRALIALIVSSILGLISFFVVHSLFTKYATNMTPGENLGLSALLILLAILVISLMFDKTTKTSENEAE